jgi:hypothetical protein
MTNLEFLIGSMRVIKVHELDLNGFAAPQLLPGLVRIPVSGVFVDSMMPLEAAGRVRRVRVDGGEVLTGFVFSSQSSS